MKIKIPRYLPFAIMSDTHLKKAIGIYLYLKSIDEEGSGVIIIDHKKLKGAATWLGVTTRTIRNC